MQVVCRNREGWYQAGEQTDERGEPKGEGDGRDVELDGIDAWQFIRFKDVEESEGEVEPMAEELEAEEPMAEEPETEEPEPMAEEPETEEPEPVGEEPEAEAMADDDSVDDDSDTASTTSSSTAPSF